MSSEKDIKQMQELWNGLNKKSKLGFISMLEEGSQWDLKEFHWVGNRFVSRMMERFREYGIVDSLNADVLEIGCGVGRFLKPLSCQFKNVSGVDISKEMLKTAEQYCAGMPNITFHLNDGNTLKSIADSSFDYCISAGVFQHITRIEVIISYIREALRVLKPGGLFLFQFDGTRNTRLGKERYGARISAEDLDDGLADQQYCIKEISYDHRDHVGNIVIVLQKSADKVNVLQEETSFKTFKMIDRHWLMGVYDDVSTQVVIRRHLNAPPRRLTFYDTKNNIIEQLERDKVKNVTVWGAGLSGQLLLEQLNKCDINVTAVYDGQKEGEFMGYFLKNPYKNEIPKEIPMIIASSRNLDELAPVVEILLKKNISFYHYK